MTTIKVLIMQSPRLLKFHSNFVLSSLVVTYFSSTPALLYPVKKKTVRANLFALK